MIFESERIWLWKRRGFPLVVHRFWIVKGPTDIYEVGRKTVRENSTEDVIGWGKKMWDQKFSLTYAPKDLRGDPEIWHVTGKYELPYGMPFPFEDCVAEWSAETAAARAVDVSVLGKVVKGAPISLKIFWHELGENHVAGWLGASRFRLMLLLLAGAVAGIVITAVAGVYFASQVHYVYVCYSLTGNAAKEILCPVTAVSTSGSSSSSSAVATAVTSTTQTVYTVP